VSSWVLQRNRAVVRAADDGAILNQHCADRNLTILKGFPGLIKGRPHEPFIATVYQGNISRKYAVNQFAYFHIL
jgi:hypothetical protein